MEHLTWDLHNADNCR